LGHYPAIAGHPGGRKLYYTLRQSYYWPSMSLDCYEVVKSCLSCAKERINLTRRKKSVTLFPASKSLEFVAIDILGPLPKSVSGNQFILVICDRFSKLVVTVPLKKITALTVAQAFCNHWVFVYGPPLKLLSDNGSQFGARFFQSCCNHLGINQLFTTAYHPQCNGQVERFNRTILSLLRVFVGEDQDQWDRYSHALTYAYNCQVHTSTKFAPFDLILSRPPPHLAIAPSEDTSRIPVGIHSQIDDVTTPDSDCNGIPDEWGRTGTTEARNGGTDGSMTGPTRGRAKSERLTFLHRLRTVVPRAQAALKSAGDRYKGNADRSRRVENHTLLTGDTVAVRAEVRVGKLTPPVSSPYTVVKAENDTVTLRDAHGTISKVSLDRVVKLPVENTPSNGGPTTNDEYVVERIVDVDRDDKGHVVYRVRWEGYTEAEDTWEPEANLPDSLVIKYLRGMALGRKRSKRSP
jgi:Chromo (CHRromatin Organisation MOdifier) domain/Integrase zinc binding domain/Integrase core domain